MIFGRNFVRVVAIVTLALTICGAQQGLWHVEFDTAHYHIQARIPKEQAEEFGKFMELVFKVYSDLMKIKEQPTNKFPLQIYADRKDYVTVGKAPPGSGAYYMPSDKRLVGYYEPASMYSFFAHEGMHQFVDVAQPDFNDVAMKATWYSEGIADCIGNCEVINKKLYMCRKNGYIAKIRLPTIKKMIETGKYVPLAQFFKLNKQQYYANAGPCYAQGWSLCHFLMTYPKVEEKDKQIPNGKYRKFLAYFHEALGAGYDLDKAYDEAMKKGNGGSKMPEIGELEKQWKEYIMNFDKPDPSAAKDDDKKPEVKK